MMRIIDPHHRRPRSRAGRQDRAHAECTGGQL